MSDAEAVTQSTDGQIVEEEQFWRLLRGRRSIRRYRSEPIPLSILEKLLTAAVWAPSAHNRQPWRFCIATEQSTKERLSAHMSERWRQDLTADGAAAEFVERRIAISHIRLTSAAALVIACATLDNMDVYPDTLRNQAEWAMTVQSTALACQNLLLAAHQYGLGACWMCAPLFVPELVQDVLQLPASWQPQALITLGYPAQGYAAHEIVKERAPLAQVVCWR
ncbi:MAG: nitroreductase family protein [Caldilineaceae bacterium]